MNVLVMHQSLTNKYGTASIMPTSKSIQPIDAVYLDGMVRTNTGDIYTVKKEKGHNYDYVTCEPKFYTH